MGCAIDTIIWYSRYCSTTLTKLRQSWEECSTTLGCSPGEMAAVEGGVYHRRFEGAGRAPDALLVSWCGMVWPCTWFSTHGGAVLIGHFEKTCSERHVNMHF